MMVGKPSLRQVIAALKEAESICVPAGDNEGDSLNRLAPFLCDLDYEKFERAHLLAYDYVRGPDGGADRRSLMALCRHGFPANLGPDQYDVLRLAGSVQIGERSLDIGDPRNREASDQ